MHNNENIPPAGHVLLAEIPNLDEKQRAFLRRRNISHGMWMLDDPQERLEVSRFGGMGEKPEWQIFRGKISDWQGWVGVKP
ncbi:MAG: hypothetical protein Q7T51_03630 [Candidatus Moranbacteria bacterium]|nr:hypothetical protein [Candidatus Moranbacteria bacterium]